VRKAEQKKFALIRGQLSFSLLSRVIRVIRGCLLIPGSESP